MSQRSQPGLLPWLLVTVVSFMLLSATYMGAYYALVIRSEHVSGTLWNYNEWYFPYYRFGGEAADIFFSPAHQVDQRIRPEYWESKEVQCSFDGFRIEREID